jgi:UDP-N-acetylmuramyl pentapeptide phosphotransferase/UDP-N-acetylglucosamine-1-phosphate transferase
MRDSEDDPEFRRLMRRIAAVDIPDYPDWKRGMKWGLLIGILIVLVSLLAFLIGDGSYWERLLKYGWQVLCFAFVVFLIVGAIGAFRPQDR